MSGQPETYDVIVIGGGPAGSSAATRTARAGLRTLVLEKETFPRFRIGESLLPHGNDLLRETGVWPKLERAGFVDKFGASFLLADGSGEKEVIFANGLFRGFDRTFQVERSRFDAILLDHATESGAAVRTGAGVDRIETDAAGHTVTAGGTTYRAPWIIDAGGRDGRYGNQPAREFEPTTWPKRVAVYNHFRHVGRAPGPAGGHTVIVRLPGGWFWLIPLDAERTSVGLVTTTAALRESRLAPADFFAGAVAASSKLTELMAGATPTGEFRVTSDYSYFRRELAGPRLVFAGDAGGFFDPIFSSGVYMACRSAKLAAENVVRAHRAGRPLTAGECRRYARTVKRHARVFQRLIEAFYDNDSFSVFMCPRPPWGLQPALTSIVAGCSELNWPMWWRFRIFLLVCRLQRHFDFVPDLKIGDKFVTAGPPHTPA